MRVEYAKDCTLGQINALGNLGFEFVIEDGKITSMEYHKPEDISDGDIKGLYNELEA